MDTQRALKTSERIWMNSIIPKLSQYITIPNISPHFDPDWQKNGHTDRAVDLLMRWTTDQEIPGLTLTKLQLMHRTPVIFMEIPGTVPGTILLYGHLDKQPGMTGWREGLSPWEAVLDGDRLYGRGGADDGYSTFAAVTALRLLVEQNITHPRIVIIIEACEESGSPDLPYYIESFADMIGTPDLVICLDSGCGNYNQLWMTNSLRGVVGGNLTVDILTEGVHSGDASGVVPESFRIMRQLLDRIDDSLTGEVKRQALHADVPPDRLVEIQAAAAILGDSVYTRFPWVDGAWPMGSDPVELLLNRTWRPMLANIGADGMPRVADAGNVLRPTTIQRLSMRIPPTVDAEVAAQAMKGELERNPPYGAHVTFNPDQKMSGWNAPSLASGLAKSVNHASEVFFGSPSTAWGGGGSTPFLSMPRL